MITFSLPRQSQLPLYQQIVQLVTQASAEGRLKPGEQLPAHLALAEQMGVSPVTVRKAYEHLHRQGVVIQRHGHGTFVAQPAESRLHQSAVTNLRRVFVVIGETSLARCNHQTAFILLNNLEGLAEVLGPQTQLIHVDSLTSKHLADANEHDAVVICFYSKVDLNHIHELLARGVELVSTIRGAEGTQLHQVGYSRKQAATLACSHLISLGHQQIGFIGSKLFRDTVTEKFATYTSCLHDAGLDMLASLVRDASMTPGKAYAAATDMIRQGGRPDAIFVDTDYKAMEVITALHDLGLSVPSDISVIGYDDLAEAAAFTPALTTVRTPRREIGRTCAKLLLASKSSQSKLSDREPQNIVLDAEVVVRASTAPCQNATTRDVNRNAD